MSTQATIQDLSQKLHKRWAWNLFPNAGDVAGVAQNLAGVERLWGEMDELTRAAWEDLACFLLHQGFSGELGAVGAKEGK